MTPSPEYKSNQFTAAGALPLPQSRGSVCSSDSPSFEEFSSQDCCRSLLISPLPLMTPSPEYKAQQFLAAGELALPLASVDFRQSELQPAILLPNMRPDSVDIAWEATCVALGLSLH